MIEYAEERFDYTLPGGETLSTSFNSAKILLMKIENANKKLIERIEHI
tara:strand:- start:566 stop:709 length:144 start_codon:yes stop_codon:yes gene_type:complete